MIFCLYFSLVIIVIIKLSQHRFSSLSATAALNFLSSIWILHIMRIRWSPNKLFLPNFYFFLCWAKGETKAVHSLLPLLHKKKNVWPENTTKTEPGGGSASTSGCFSQSLSFTLILFHNRANTTWQLAECRSKIFTDNLLYLFAYNILSCRKVPAPKRD